MRSFINYTDSGGAAFLNSLRGAPGQVTADAVAELFTISLVNGTSYRWTSYDRSLTAGANTWLAPIDGAPLITRNRWGVKKTIEVPELELRLGASDALLGNLKTQIHNALFSGARVEMDRVFMPAPGDTRYGYVLLFNGRMSTATIDAEGITLTAKGDNVLMNQMAPKNLYQTTCLHTFCDAGCTLLESNFTVAGTVATGSTASKIAWTPTGGLSGSLFTLGKVAMTSGAANGQIRTVALSSGLTMILTYPLYNAPAIGDTFNATMGCARTQTACENHTDKNGNPVNNIQHSRMFPYVPVAQIAV